MKFEHIIVESVEDDRGVVRLTINRPEKLNAIASRTRAEIEQALIQIAKDKRAKCLIITGAGRRAFSSGEDLQESVSLTGQRVPKWTRDWVEFFSVQVMKFPLPIVTAASGFVVGAGWQLFLLGDLRIASKNTSFAFPEVDMGLPSVLSGAILLSMIGMSQLGRLTLMGEKMTAKEAFDLGLVHKIVSESELAPNSTVIAKKLASKPVTAMRLQRTWIQDRLLENFKKHTDLAPMIYEKAFLSKEPENRIVSFLSGKQKSRKNRKSRSGQK